MIHTSESIQKLYPEIYQELFSTSDCVVSGHFSFSWFPSSLGSNEIGIKIRQKIPLKGWIGLKKNNNQQLSFISSKFFNHSIGNFYSREYGQVDQNISISMKTCSDLFQHHFNITPHYDLSLVSEIERGYGCGLSGTVMMLICINIALAESIIQTSQLGDIGNKVIIQLHDIAFTMEQIAKHNNASCAPLMSLISDTEPVFFCPNNQDSLHYKYGSIPSLFNETPLTELPIGSILITSGQSSNNKYVEKLKITDRKVLNEHKDLFQSVFGEEVCNAMCLNQDMYSTIIKTGVMLSIELFNSMKDLYYYGKTNQTSQKFIQQVNNIGYLTRIAHQHDDFYDHIRNIINNNKLLKDESIGYTPTYSSRGGGTYLIVYEQEETIETINKSLIEIKKSYPLTTIIHQSNPSIKYSTIICHQLISDGIFSHHVDKYDLSYLDNQGNSMIGSIEEIMKQYGSETLIIDSINNKIICKGVKLTSKQLHSQITTVEVLQGLLDHPDRTISNSQLAPSSLTKQQNQMLGKIILPLQKVVQEYRGVKLPLECHGNLRNFTLSLGSTPVPIGIIKSLS